LIEGSRETDEKTTVERMRYRCTANGMNLSIFLKVSKKSFDARPQELLMFILSRFARVHKLRGSTDEATGLSAIAGR